MIKMFFWVLIVFALSVVAVIVAAHQNLTHQQMTLVYGCVIAVCLVTLLISIFYLVYRGLRKGVYLVFCLLCVLAIVFCILHFRPDLWQQAEHAF
jgi:tellurite resistance protein TehA-like permease